MTTQKTAIMTYEEYKAIGLTDAMIAAIAEKNPSVKLAIAAKESEVQTAKNLVIKAEIEQIVEAAIQDLMGHAKSITEDATDLICKRTGKTREEVQFSFKAIGATWACKPYNMEPSTKRKVSDLVQEAEVTDTANLRTKLYYAYIKYNGEVNQLDANGMRVFAAQKLNPTLIGGKVSSAHTWWAQQLGNSTSQDSYRLSKAELTLVNTACHAWVCKSVKINTASGSASSYVAGSELLHDMPEETAIYQKELLAKVASANAK